MVPSVTGTWRSQNQGIKRNLWPLGTFFPPRCLCQNSSIYIWVPCQSQEIIKAFLEVNFMHTVGKCTDEDNAEGWALVMEKVFWALQKWKTFSFLIPCLSHAIKQISSQKITFFFPPDFDLSVKYSAPVYLLILPQIVFYFSCFPTVPGSLSPAFPLPG